MKMTTPDKVSLGWVKKCLHNIHLALPCIPEDGETLERFIRGWEEAGIKVVREEA